MCVIRGIIGVNLIKLIVFVFRKDLKLRIFWNLFPLNAPKIGLKKEKLIYKTYK